MLRLAAVVALCALVAPAQAQYSAGVELDVRVAGRIGAPTAAWVYDANFPDVTAANEWDRWLWYLLHNELPPGTRVFCSVEVKEYSEDIGSARAAADAVGSSYGPTESAVSICNGILAAGP